MTNSTADYWSIDGVSLQTLGWGISEFGGSLESPPPIRGGNLTVPYRPGEVWRPGVAGARTLSFPMWVSNTTDAGASPSESQLLTNWYALRSLFWGSPGSQRTIVKRWSGGSATATGYGTCAGGLEPTSLGMQAIKFVGEIRMADPYFYGSVQNLPTVDSAGDILGTAPSPRYTVALTSSAVVTVLKGTTVLSKLTAVSLAGTLTVTFPDMTWTASDPSDHPGKVKADQPGWLQLSPEATSVTITGGTAAVTYYPAYV